MEYLVCKNKDNGKLFITTRKARETSNSVLIDLGHTIESIVLKAFDNYEQAYKYEQQMNNTDDTINQIISE
jgi:hypothetical protein